MGKKSRRALVTPQEIRNRQNRKKRETYRSNAKMNDRAQGANGKGE